MFILLPVLLFLFWFIHVYGPTMIVEIKNPIMNGGRYQLPTIKFPSDPKLGEHLFFKSFDDTQLSAYISYSQKEKAKGTIILLHGIRAYKEQFIELSEVLASHGYNSVAVDLRAHGQSEGRFCTFGVKEKQDISALMDTLLASEKLTTNIGVWGQSLGGAVALQSMGFDKRIKFGIIESTFSDFKSITHDYVKYHTGFNIQPLTDYFIKRAQKIADFDMEIARPIDFCSFIDQPIIVAHGTIDRRISIDYGRANFDEIKSEDKSFFEIEKANHLTVWQEGGPEYFDQIFAFLDRVSN